MRFSCVCVWVVGGRGLKKTNNIILMPRNVAAAAALHPFFERLVINLDKEVDFC